MMFSIYALKTDWAQLLNAVSLWARASNDAMPHGMPMVTWDFPSSPAAQAVRAFKCAIGAPTLSYAAYHYDSLPSDTRCAMLSGQLYVDPTSASVDMVRQASAAWPSALFWLFPQHLHGVTRMRLRECGPAWIAGRALTLPTLASAPRRIAPPQLEQMVTEALAQWDPLRPAPHPDDVGLFCAHCGVAERHHGTFCLLSPTRFSPLCCGQITKKVRKDDYDP